MTKEFFLEDNDIKEEILVNDQKIKAIRYSVLKNKLLESKEEFTNGAVTGALYTLTDKIDSIFKTKTNNGVYFYLSEEPQELFKNNVVITETKEYEQLQVKASQLYDDVGLILVNASNGFYKEANDLDVYYLRKLLGVNSELKSVLKEYKMEKSFEKIEYNKEDSDHVDTTDEIHINSDDLPF